MGILRIEGLQSQSAFQWLDRLVRPAGVEARHPESDMSKRKTPADLDRLLRRPNGLLQFVGRHLVIANGSWG